MAYEKIPKEKRVSSRAREVVFLSKVELFHNYANAETEATFRKDRWSGSFESHHSGFTIVHIIILNPISHNPTGSVASVSSLTNN
jgi:hypothetical protein